MWKYLSFQQTKGRCKNIDLKKCTYKYWLSKKKNCENVNLSKEERNMWKYWLFKRRTKIYWGLCSTLIKRTNKGTRQTFIMSFLSFEVSFCILKCQNIMLMIIIMTGKQEPPWRTSIDCWRNVGRMVELPANIGSNAATLRHTTLVWSKAGSDDNESNLGGFPG